MTRTGDQGPARDSDPGPSPPPEFGSILAGLSEEICRPLESLRGGIDRLLADPSRPITEAERVQARTMLGLCDDLDKLTRECLEGAGPCTDA